MSNVLKHQLQQKKDDMHWHLFDINLKLLGQSSDRKRLEI